MGPQLSLPWGGVKFFVRILNMGGVKNVNTFRENIGIRIIRSLKLCLCLCFCLCLSVSGSISVSISMSVSASGTVSCPIFWGGWAGVFVKEETQPQYSNTVACCSVSVFISISVGSLCLRLSVSLNLGLCLCLGLDLCLCL